MASKFLVSRGRKEITKTVYLPLNDCNWVANKAKGEFFKPDTFDAKTVSWLLLGCKNSRCVIDSIKNKCWFLKNLSMPCNDVSEATLSMLAFISAVTKNLV